MKQILITVIMLSTALALVIGIIVPIMKHGEETGKTAVLKGEAAVSRMSGILR
jgi:hypothetical protein